MSRAAKFKAALSVDELTERQGRAEHKRLAEEIAPSRQALSRRRTRPRSPTPTTTSCASA